MILHPKPGQAATIHYRKGAPRNVLKFDGCGGMVTRVARTSGRHGPVNVEVRLWPAASDIRVIVPRGNLIAMTRNKKRVTKDK